MTKRIFIIAAMFLFFIVISGCNGQWMNGGQGGGGGQGQGGGGGQGRNHPKATDEEVKQAFQQVMEGFRRKDIAALDQLFAANASLITPALGPQVMIWADARPQFVAKFKNLGETEYSFTQISEATNRDMGWVAAKYHIRAQNDKGVDEADGGATVVFRKTDEGYKVVAFQTARFAPPANAPPAPLLKDGKK